MTSAPDLVRGAPRRVFRDRREAGRVLAGLLGAYREKTMWWCWGWPVFSMTTQPPERSSR